MYAFSSNPLLANAPSSSTQKPQQGKEATTAKSGSASGTSEERKVTSSHQRPKQQQLPSSDSAAKRPPSRPKQPSSKLSEQDESGDVTLSKGKSNSVGVSGISEDRKVTFQASSESEEHSINPQLRTNMEYNHDALIHNFQQTKNSSKPFGQNYLNDKSQEDSSIDIAEFRPKFQGSASAHKKEKPVTNNNASKLQQGSHEHTIGLILNEYERGMVLYDKGQYEASLERFNECLNIFMKSKIEDAEMCANIFLAMGISYYGQGDEESALELYHRCIQRLEDKFGKNFPGIVSPLVNIALVYTNQKRFDEALGMFQKAQKLAESK